MAHTLTHPIDSPDEMTSLIEVHEHKCYHKTSGFNSFDANCNTHNMNKAGITGNKVDTDSDYEDCVSHKGCSSHFHGAVAGYGHFGPAHAIGEHNHYEQTYTQNYVLADLDEQIQDHDIDDLDLEGLNPEEAYDAIENFHKGGDVLEEASDLAAKSPEAAQQIADALKVAKDPDGKTILTKEDEAKNQEENLECTVSVEEIVEEIKDDPTVKAEIKEATQAPADSTPIITQELDTPAPATAPM